MADSLGDLGCPVEDRILVLNVLRGLGDRYTHLRSLLMRQRPFPTFLQVRDDLALEEITLGAQAASISGPGSSSSSTALAAFTPTRPPTPSQSALGHRPPGPSMGGGGRWRWWGQWWSSTPRWPRWQWWWRVRRWCPWQRTGAGTPAGCALAHLPPPVVRAHLHVAVPGARF